MQEKQILWVDMQLLIRSNSDNLTGFYHHDFLKVSTSKRPKRRHVQQWVGITGSYIRTLFLTLSIDYCNKCLMQTGNMIRLCSYTGWSEPLHRLIASQIWDVFHGLLVIESITLPFICQHPYRHPAHTHTSPPPPPHKGGGFENGLHLSTTPVIFKILIWNFICR